MGAVTTISTAPMEIPPYRKQSEYNTQLSIVAVNCHSIGEKKNLMHINYHMTDSSISLREWVLVEKIIPASN